MRLTKEELRAVLALRTDPNFQTFMSALAREAEGHMRTLIFSDMDTEKMLRTQGATRMISAVCEAIVEAEQHYAQHEQPRT